MTSKYSKYSTGDPEWEPIFEAMQPEGNVAYDPAVLKAESKLWPIPKRSPEDEAAINIEDLNIDVDGGEKILVRAYTPKDTSEGPYPVFVFMHGGGFMLGTVDLDDAWLASVSATKKMTILNVDYRLTPEYKFPVALNDCLAVLRWAVMNEANIKADTTRGFIVGGASAGANLAAVVSLIARDDPQLKGKLTGQFLVIPFLCEQSVYPEKWRDELRSSHDLENAPFLPQKMMDLALKYYAPPSRSDWKVSPLLAPSHKGLPPAVLYVAGHDVLRDEGILYSQVLEKAGVKSKLYIYSGVPHGFHAINSVSAAAQEYYTDTEAGLSWLLNL